MKTRPKISACVTTFNEERNIRRCLESVRWCDEIVVVDSFSSDRTVEICREYTPRVYQHPWQGYIGQKNYIRRLASHEWILFIDADEEVSPELREEIERELASNDGRIAGYRFPRMVNYLGKWIRHGEWYPDYKLRLFLRERGRSGGTEPHDQVFVDGEVKTLKSPLYHYTYDDIHDHLETMNRFSSITAREKFKIHARFRWRDFLLRPPLRFLKAYIFRGGFLDGRRGFLIAVISAFGVCMKYAKLWELEYRQQQGERPDV
ncbi:MAG: glycosyltransferase family 2 protein [Kiritimatiellae bacterium]|nr:glycosyltransferase family 2 protein [Kiritimatiellia bacterium]MDW8459193.1 glycosyltransferase family 2 protein [Verrucomicrobiota bacterium]